MPQSAPLVVVAVVVLAGLSTASGAPAADRVTSLPGWSGDLPSAQYSGYITVGANKDKHIHYWFSESLGDPTTDPVVMWTNGGPGASSLIGMFTELGLFSLNANSMDPNNSSAVPTLFQNPYTWNAHANMLYFEAPAGVGFSYCEVEDDCVFNDTSTAMDNYDAVSGFFAKFPEYLPNKFAITGESYAGIYIPTLVEQIEAHAGQPGAPAINLQGFAIGDGCIGSEVGACGPPGTQINVEFLYDMGMYSPTTHSKLLSTCKDFSNPSTDCMALLQEMDTEAGDFDVYNVFDECGNDQMWQTWSEDDAEHTDDTRGTFMRQYGVDPATGRFTHRKWWQHPEPMSFIGDDSWLQRTVRKYTAQTAAKRSHSVGADGNVGGALNDYVCGGEAAMSAYLANKAVQEAIHVKTDVPSFPFKYTRSLKSLLPAYPGLIEKYKVLIYSGSVDACIPFVGTEEWTAGLGLPVKSPWTQWKYERSTAAGSIRGGYKVVYDSNDFTFQTIAGSGHMVPQFQPPAALALFQGFLAMWNGNSEGR